MSTRSQLRFVQRIEHDTDDGGPEKDVRIAQVYRHSDGYPEAVLLALQRLQTLLRTTRTEPGPSYAAATFIHVEKCRAMRFYLDRGPGRFIAAQSPEDVLDVRSWIGLEPPTFLLGYGVEDPANGIHGDEKYLSVFELPEFHHADPAESDDWHVAVSEHGRRKRRENSQGIMVTAPVHQANANHPFPAGRVTGPASRSGKAVACCVGAIEGTADTADHGRRTGGGP